MVKYLIFQSNNQLCVQEQCKCSVSAFHRHRGKIAFFIVFSSLVARMTQKNDDKCKEIQ